MNKNSEGTGENNLLVEWAIYSVTAIYGLLVPPCKLLLLATISGSSWLFSPLNWI